MLVHALLDGATQPEALAQATVLLRAQPAHEETLHALDTARTLAASGHAHEAAIARLGEGWVAEEALAIAVYCALVADDFAHGVRLAVNHDGDSDSTGAIAGHLLGTQLGDQAIPTAWRERLELRELIIELATDLHAFKDWPIGEYSDNLALNEAITRKYPGD